MARAEKKQLVADVLHNLNLCTVFLALGKADRKMHQTVLRTS